MRLIDQWARIGKAAVLILALGLLPGCTLEAGDDAARALAGKFAAGTAAEEKEAPAPAAETSAPAAPIVTVVNTIPSETTEAAPKPAEAPRPTGTDKSQKAEKARAEKAKAEAEKAKAEKDRQEKAAAALRREDQRRADEVEMLTRARAEVEEQQRRRETEQAEAAAAEKARADDEIRLAAKRRVEEELKAADAKIAAEDAQKAREARKIDEARKAEEAQRVETARLAEAERRNDEQRKAVETQRTENEARRMAEAKRLADETEARRIALEAKRLADEEASRAAEVARQDEARRSAENARRIENERRIAEENRAAADRARLAETARIEAERQERTRQLTTNVSHEQAPGAERQGLGMAPQAPQTLMSPPFATGPMGAGKGPATSPRVAGPRVTVLLVMQIGDRGIRRFTKTADPILCLPQRCYVSQGPAADAKAITRGQAFGPGVALGTRAGGCNHQPACVFRNVELDGGSTELQPIDLRILRHDRREAKIVSPDVSCGLDGGRLTCRQPVQASDYTIWVVPESTAAEAGAQLLQTTVQAGLGGTISAELKKN